MFIERKINLSKLLRVVMYTVCTLLLTVTASALDCIPYSQDINSLIKSSKNNISERANELLRIEEVGYALANKISQMYLNTKADKQNTVNELLACLIIDKKIDPSFEAILQEVIWSKSIQALSTFGAKSSLLVEAYRLKPKLRFNLGHSYHNHEQEKVTKAYYHRGEKSIFMDMTKIPSNEWPIILTHELVHAVDDNFMLDVNRYGETELLKKMQKLANDYYFNNKIILTQQEELDLALWIKSSIGRGLLAEVRAWAVTFVIYKEAIKHKKINSIPWMENILKDKGVEENYFDFSFRYFDPRFISSYHDWFVIPFFKDTLNEIRNSYRRKETLIPVDDLLSRILY